MHGGVIRRAPTGRLQRGAAREGQNKAHRGSSSTHEIDASAADVEMCSSNNNERARALATVARRESYDMRKFLMIIIHILNIS